MSVTYIEAVARLHDALPEVDDKLDPAFGQSLYHNHWFTEEHIQHQWSAIKTNYLDPQRVSTWLEAYPCPTSSPKRVGVICAGNLPMVGMHDLLCVLASGHEAIVKCSSKDAYLLPAFWACWLDLVPAWEGRVQFVDRLTDVDAVIATGSNNAHRYFEAYFGHLPHLLRKSRTSIAVLTEGFEDYDGLVDDIFLHFGLGCRNVSQLFLAEGMSLDPIFEASLKYSHYLKHSKYQNNFVYHTSVFQMNKVPHLTNDFVILKDSDQLFSPLSVLYYHRYTDLDEVRHFINEKEEDIQAVYSDRSMDGLQIELVGTGQRPRLEDYMDGVDTMTWLMNL